MNPRQLDRVTPNLTPKQAVLAWIKEMQTHSSITAYSKATVDRPPLRTVYEQIEDAVRKRLAGESKGVIYSAIRNAQREAAFLGSVARECTFRIRTGEESFRLKHGVVVFMLDNIRLRLELEGEMGPVAFEEVQEWSALLHADCHGYQLAVNTIEAAYFDGHRILSRDASGALETRLQVSEEIANRLKLDKTLLRRSRREAAQRLVSRWVHMAKAEAHHAMGETAPAGRFADLAMDA